MDDAVIPLAAGFAPVTEARWRELARKTLRGAASDTLTSRGADGLEIAPLYVADDGPTPIGFTPAPRNAEAPWDVRVQIDHPGRGEARALIADALAGGARSLLIRIDPSAKTGVALGSAADTTELLADVTLEETTVALDAGFLGKEAAEWLAAAAKGSPLARMAFHLDPLSAFARAGETPGPIDSFIEEGAVLAARLAEPHPGAGVFLASGAVVHEAGGGQAWELAFALAGAVAYAKAMVAAGLEMGEAFSRIAVGLAADTDTLVSIAKLRAARVLWARVTQACEVGAPLSIEVRSSARMLVAGDPWTNLVRLTGAAFAGAVGGADSLVLGTFTDPLGLATPFARRLSRNIQLILMEEAHLGRVADPLGGAWAVESLTRETARAAWSRFGRIEAAGGAARALADGLIAAEVAEERKALAGRLAAGDFRIVGVTDFRHEGEPAPLVESVAIESVRPPDVRRPGPDSHCPPLAPIRLEDLIQ